MPLLRSIRAGELTYKLPTDMAFDQQLKLAFQAKEFSAYLGKNYLIVSP